MILVISDTHLGKYDKEKDKFLQNLIKDYDNVIINGDFWDNWAITFKDFINSDYKELFQLLKKKNAIYIFGNHDLKKDIDTKLANVFSDLQVSEYDIKINGKKYHFEHGHRFISQMNNAFYRRYYNLLEKLPKNLLYKINILGYYLFPKIIAKNKIAKKRNDFIKEHKPRETFYIIGDTHIPEIDIKNKFANSGCILGKLVSYVVIDDEGCLKLFIK